MPSGRTLATQVDPRLPVSIGEFVVVLKPAPYFPKLVGFKPESHGLRVVKGNADVAFPGTRYVPTTLEEGR